MKKPENQEELAALLVDFALYARLVRNDVNVRARHIAGNDSDLFKQLLVAAEWLR